MYAKDGYWHTRMRGEKVKTLNHKTFIFPNEKLRVTDALRKKLINRN